jgi:hypothetical protein
MKADTRFKKILPRPKDAADLDLMSCRGRASVLAKAALTAAYPVDIEANGVETAITDLLADVRHLCDLLNFTDFAELDRAAYLHYSAEVSDDRATKHYKRERSI